MNYIIKKASIEDAEVIRKIAFETWGPTYGEILSPEQISFMLEKIYSPNNIINELSHSDIEYLLLLEEDRRPVAFASYSPRKDEPEIFKLHKLYCLPETQGKGYGRILIDHVFKKVADTGKIALDLNVNKYNKALGFYEKMGFKVIQEEDISIGPYFMNDYVMRKEV